MKMYIEPELEIIKFEESEVNTISVSNDNTPGSGPSIDYSDI